jgi:nucleotide-binding universal stress UspA family protein
MNSYGTLLVHLDNSQRSDARLGMARRIKEKLNHGSTNGCAINALYAPTPHYMSFPSAYGEMSGLSFEILAEAHQKNMAAVKKRFDHWKVQTQEDAHWVESDTQMALNRVINQSWFCDLLVLGQFDTDPKVISDIPTDFTQSLIIQSAAPAVVLPHSGAYPSIGTHVLIAWKPTREANHALRASIPFLQRAESIHVVADLEPNEQVPMQRRFEGYLRSNNILAAPRYHSLNSTDSVGERLLSLAADVQADLLVMGCYGHSRLREFMIGGVSKTILSSMTLPVLMCH